MRSLCGPNHVKKCVGVLYYMSSKSGVDVAPVTHPNISGHVMVIGFCRLLHHWHLITEEEADKKLNASIINSKLMRKRIFSTWQRLASLIQLSYRKNQKNVVLMVN